MPTSEESPLSSQRSVMPLAPLEYLQTQRRGSITDPSLHAAKQSQNSQPFRPPSDPSAPSSSSSTPRDSKDEPRPSSAYTFGDATAPHNSTDSPGLRKILRSPSSEYDGLRPNMSDSPSAEKDTRVENDARRGSTTSELEAVTGMKRKMSSDRTGGGEEKKPEGLVDMDVDAPAPKRRMSTIDTARIASLSLNDRRHSADPRWFSGDRRNSASTIYPAYSSAFSGSEGRAPSGIATFAWPSNSHSAESGTMQHPTDAPPHPSTSQQIVMMPHMTHLPDRRMSVPDTLTSPATGPTRVLRSRSRPPSRQMRNSDAATSQSTSPELKEEAAASPGSAAASSKAGKEPGATPYSRSPELRVSHKLAERKRRKEMKDLFDELRDQLPADRGMKASKWEILSKAIDFVCTLKNNHQEMVREIDSLRHEIDVLRQAQGMPPQFGGGPPPHALVYSQGPPMAGPYPPMPPPGVMQHPQHPPPPPHAPQHAPHPQQPPSQPPAQAPLSRPASSQNMFPPSGPASAAAAPSSQQNGTIARTEPPPT